MLTKQQTNAIINTELRKNTNKKNKKIKKC